MPDARPRFDVFLSHSHDDAEWVEELASRLEDECDFSVWLDKWVLVPGKSWQQAMAKGLEEASCCAVFIGKKTPAGWFNEEIERALDLQTRNPSFRVIPVLLPDARAEHVPAFLSPKTWADFREIQERDYAFHVLKQGIGGEPIGRWPPKEDAQSLEGLVHFERRLKELKRLGELVQHDEVLVEFERRILDQWFDQRARK